METNCFSEIIRIFIRFVFVEYKNELSMKELKIKMRGKSLNKNRIIIIQGIFSVVAFCMLLISCNPIVKTLGPFSSNSIVESKKIGAFLWEYYPADIMINDNTHFVIKEVFAEKLYSYKSYKDLRYNISEDATQIRIVLSNPSLSKYFELWSVENFYFAGDYGLVSNYYDKKNPPDSLLVKILKKDVADDGGVGKDDGKVLGSFTLRRKQ